MDLSQEEKEKELTSEAMNLNTIEHELLGEEQKEVEKSLSSVSGEILFEYEMQASYGKGRRDFGEFCVKILNNGQLVHCKYIFGKGLPFSMRTYKLDPDIFSFIKQIVDTNQAIINSMPEYIENGVMDGKMQTFQFYDKKIGITNIQYMDMEKIRQENPDYYNKFKDALVYSNKLLDIFNDISNALKKSKYHFTLDKFKKSLF